MNTHKLCLKKDKEFTLLRGHPWAFAEAFKTLPEKMKTGEGHRPSYLFRYKHNNND